MFVLRVHLLCHSSSQILQYSKQGINCLVAAEQNNCHGVTSYVPDVPKCGRTMRQLCLDEVRHVTHTVALQWGLGAPEHHPCAYSRLCFHQSSLKVHAYVVMAPTASSHFAKDYIIIAPEPMDLKVCIPPNFPNFLMMKIKSGIFLHTVCRQMSLLWPQFYGPERSNMQKMIGAFLISIFALYWLSEKNTEVQ